MKIFVHTFLLACMAFSGANVRAQVTATPAAAAAIPAPEVEGTTPKQIAAMKAKLADWPQLAYYREANASLAPVVAGEQRVVFYGDSITYGWGKRPGSTFFPGKPFVNRGITGQTTAQMVVRFRQDVIDLHPAAVVILAGTNDIAAGPITPEMTEDNFRSMTELADANGIKVILASITPAVAFPSRRVLDPAPKIRAMNVWLKDFCERHRYTWLNYYPALTDAAGGMKPGISVDGVHPNAQGYAIMEPLAQAAIDKTLGGK